jgi:DNA polymerase III sliding clamp (beta) subunit (PCNA family)
MNKFIISCYLFAKALNEARRVQTKNPKVSIIENFLIVVEQGFLTVAATDLHRNIEVKVRCETRPGTSFKAVIPAKVLTFLNECEDQPITCSWEESLASFSIHTDCERMGFTGELASDFPVFAKMTDPKEYNFPIQVFDDLGDMLNFSHEDGTRLDIAGVHLGSSLRDMELTATNGFVIKNTKYSGYPFDASIILPASVARLLSCYKSSKKSSISEPLLKAQSGLVCFTFVDHSGLMDITITAKTTELEYPDWRKKLKVSYERIFEGKTRDTLLLLTKVNAIKDRFSSLVTLTFHQDALMDVEYVSIDDGTSYKGVTSGEFSGSGIKIGFTIQYLKTILESIKTKGYKMLLNSPLDCVSIEVDNTTYYIAPAEIPA